MSDLGMDINSADAGMVFDMSFHVKQLLDEEEVVEHHSLGNKETLLLTMQQEF
jgi:hypothetical protein